MIFPWISYDGLLILSERNSNFYGHIPINLFKTDENYVYSLVESSCIYFTLWVIFPLFLRNKPLYKDFLKLILKFRPVIYLITKSEKMFNEMIFDLNTNFKCYVSLKCSSFPLVSPQSYWTANIKKTLRIFYLMVALFRPRNCISH